MSAFHRIDDVYAMPARRFIDFALRLPAYKGILRALIERQAHDEQTADVPPAARPAPTPSRDPRQNRTLPSDANTLLTDAAFAGQIEVRQSHG